MEQLAPILQAFVSLAWVVLAYVILFLFRREIVGALTRLKKGKLFGQEFELRDELEQLDASARAAVKEVQQLPSLPNSSAAAATQDQQIDAAIEAILNQATHGPKLALIALSAELEKRARRALAARGALADKSTLPLSQALDELRRYGFPPNMAGTLKAFEEVRNKIVHGRAASEDDALQALDSGITILKALDALPNETNVVYHPGVEIFSDSGGTSPLQGKGVILETTSPGGMLKSHRIFPTTRTHFQKGKQVAWEWNMGKVWPAAWYRDPDTGELKNAWGSAAEFIGRHLDEI